MAWTASIASRALGRMPPRAPRVCALVWSFNSVVECKQQPLGLHFAVKGNALRAAGCKDRCRAAEVGGCVVAPCGMGENVLASLLAGRPGATGSPAELFRCSSAAAARW